MQKVEGQAEAIRFYNYPFQAIEEALANAVYHKNYEEREPIEVNIRKDRIEILSHGGAMPPIMPSDFKKERIISRKYLNRRIGDFLKELHLTEGKGTGIPKIKRAMKNNGSDEPIFETDEDRSYFLVILPARVPTAPLFPSDDLYPSDQLRPIATDYDHLSAEEKSIMLHLHKNGQLTKKEALSFVNVGETKLKEIFNEMIEKKYIVRKGQGRGTYYVLFGDKI